MQRTDGVSGESKTYYLHTDHLGSVVSVTDSAGTLTPKPDPTDPTISQRYYAYGRERVGNVSDLPTDYAFTGQKQDNTGLMYFNARYFDPEIGAFISPDTIVADPTNVYDYNRYMAFRGNPMSNTDPTGHCPMCVTGLIGATIGAGFAYGFSVAANISNNGLSVDAFTSDVNWSAVGKGAIVGGVAGLTGGMGAAYLGTSLGATAFTGVMAGQAAVATSNIVDGETWNTGMGDPKQMAIDAVLAVGISAVADAFTARPCSFSAETEVLTEDGLKAISSVKPGEFVWAWDEANQRTALYPVVAQFAHLDPAIVTLVVNGETIYTTPEHPFYVVGKGWVGAGSLIVGDSVRRVNGSSDNVQQIEIVQRSQFMYNLTVAQAHTFFVGDGHWLVHNACWTSTSNKSTTQNAYSHWQKHASEFPELQNAKQYVEAAKEFLNNHPSTALVKTRPSGELVVYDPTTNTFGVATANGTPRTMFRPDPTKHGYSTNLDYYNAQ